MTNIDRLKMEIKGIDYTDEELQIFLKENELNGNQEYIPESKTNKRNILKTALAILNAVANNVNLMRQYKTDDISIFQFSDSLQTRIANLYTQIRDLKEDDNTYTDGALFQYIFKD